MFRQIIHLFLDLRVPRTGFLIFSLWLVGCKSDPYESVVLSAQRAEEPRNVPPPYAMLEGEENILFSEGVESSYYYQFHVPGGGEPIVEVLNPPEEGFRFDQKQSKIIWQPSFKAANNSFNEIENKRLYPVVLRLRSNEEDVVYHDISLSVVVQDGPQDFYIEGDDKLEIVENVPIHYPFKIVNMDFPYRPHQVIYPDPFINNLLGPFTQQDNINISSSWSIDMTLPIDFMNVNDSELKDFYHKAALSSGNTSYNCTSSERGCVLKHTLTMQAIAPNGHKATKDIKLVIKEQRNPPEVAMMEDMAVQKNGVFYFRLKDPNMEMAPFVSLVDEGHPHIIDYPQLGVNRLITDNISIEVQNGGSFESIVLIHVRNIPDELVGKKLGIQFGACNYNYNGDSWPYSSKQKTIDLKKHPDQGSECDESPNATNVWAENQTTCQVTEKILLNSYINYHHNKNCIVVDIALPIIDTKFPSPYFDRNEWPLNETRYVKMGQMKVIDLPIYERISSEEDLEVPPMILAHHMDFFDGVQEGEVRWENGKLFIDAKTLGDKSFAITAVNNVDEMEQALFSLNILPADWSPMLLATGNLHGKQAQSLLELLQLKPRDHWDITLNEDEFIDLNTRDTLALRETLIISSDALRQEASHVAVLDRYRKHFKNIIVTTPFIEKLPPGLTGEMEEYGLYAYAHYQDIFSPARRDYVPINKLIFETDVRGFSLEKPQGEVFLSGDFSAEAKNPMTLTSSYSECKALLQLKHKINASYRFPMVFRCPRDNGGYLVLISFDITDLQAPDDPGLLKSWLEQMIKE